LLREVKQPHERQRFKLRRMSEFGILPDGFYMRLNLAQQPQQILIGNLHAVDADALVVAVEVRRSVTARPIARRAQNRRHELHHRAFPVRAADENDRIFPMGVADPLQQGANPLQPRLDAEAGQAFQIFAGKLNHC